MFDQFSGAHLALAMPKNWDSYKDIIEELYTKQGHTLEELRKRMRIEHGLSAAPRTYKLKLDEWNIRKNKQREKVPPRKGHSRDASPRSGYVPSDDNSSTSTTNSSVNGDGNVSHELSPLSTLSSEKSHIHALDVYEEQFGLAPEPSLTSSTSDQPYFWNAAQSNLQQEPLDVLNDLGPIVNSSLMFFASRTSSKSLHLLAKFPTMAPRAMEILLRNWKAGGEYMHYALRFLKDSSYCHTLLSVNWTRWTHRDETLFDLIEMHVPEEEQAALTKAVLRADLMFRHPLERLHAGWASTWRLALQKQEWKAARDYLLKFRTLEVYHILLKCALAVVAEELLQRKKEILGNWKGESEPFPEHARRQYMEVLNDCHELQIEVDPALQRSMRILWM